MSTLANSEDPDEIQHDAAFHQGLTCLLRQKTSSEKLKPGMSQSQATYSTNKAK